MAANLGSDVIAEWQAPFQLKHYINQSVSRTSTPATRETKQTFLEILKLDCSLYRSVRAVACDVRSERSTCLERDSDIFVRDIRGKTRYV